ncbi:hypothetical protein LINGRAHAP2_LOCUS24339 [Linum grandiflorum]
MTVFEIPEGIIEDVHSLMMNFWWGQKSDERRIHWLSRPELSSPKAEGGMGFRDLRGFNTLDQAIVGAISTTECSYLADLES